MAFKYVCNVKNVEKRQINRHYYELTETESSIFGQKNFI